MSDRPADAVLSLVFVHGFQGDHTSFQSFPTDLHLALLPHIPTVQTFVYPTYKARRSVEHATQELLKWMKTAIPAGPVVLLGHSMGGVLIVEAAFKDGEGGERVIGLINFDVPFLGVHPHVVVSGLASLFKHKDDKPEHEMNDASAVNMPRPGQPSPNPSTTDLSSSSVSPISPTSANSANSYLAPPSLHLSQPLPQHEPNQFLSAAFATLNLGPPPEALNSKLHWLLKHRSAPFTGAYKHVSETMEFAGCLVDPAGLWARYDKLGKWGMERRPPGAGQGGPKWVNYWTETVPKPKPKPVPKEGEEGDGEGPAAGGEREHKEDDSEDEGYATAEEGEGEEGSLRIRVGEEAVRKETMSMALIMGGVAEPGAAAGMSTSTLSTPSALSTVGSVDSGVSGKTAGEQDPEEEKDDKPDAPASAEPAAEEVEPAEKEGKADAEDAEAQEASGDAKTGEKSLEVDQEPQSEPTPEAEPPEDHPLTEEERAVKEKAARQAEEKAIKQAQKERERAEKEARKERERAEKTERKEREAAQRAAQKEVERAAKEAKKAQQQAIKDAQARAKAEKKANQPDEPHHFITLPFGVTKQNEWIRVKVDGVDDEVAAHCGIFFPAENSEYDWLVEDARERVERWWNAYKAGE